MFSTSRTDRPRTNPAITNDSNALGLGHVLAEQLAGFHLYDQLAPSHRVDDLLTELDRDPTCIFWG